MSVSQYIASHKNHLVCVNYESSGAPHKSMADLGFKIMCGSRWEDRGCTPLENHIYMGFYRKKHPWKKLDCFPLENVGPPLDLGKSTVFSVIKPLDPLCSL